MAQETSEMDRSRLELDLFENLDKNNIFSIFLENFFKNPKFLRFPKNPKYLRFSINPKGNCGEIFFSYKKPWRLRGPDGHSHGGSAGRQGGDLPRADGHDVPWVLPGGDMGSVFFFRPPSAALGLHFVPPHWPSFVPPPWL